jgi:hypothetical protein
MCSEYGVPDADCLAFQSARDASDAARPRVDCTCPARERKKKTATRRLGERNRQRQRTGVGHRKNGEGCTHIHPHPHPRRGSGQGSRWNSTPRFGSVLCLCGGYRSGSKSGSVETKRPLRVLRSVSRHNQGWALPTKKVGPRLASSAFGAPNPKTRVTACVGACVRA